MVGDDGNVRSSLATGLRLETDRGAVEVAIGDGFVEVRYGKGALWAASPRWTAWP
jgi:hypothetical protein